MPRIALAAVVAAVLGSGCVVETTPICNSGTLFVDWSFVTASGNTGYCSSGMSQSIGDVDVWVDGYLEATGVPCTDYGVALPGFPAGWHDVMVAGYNGAWIIARDAVSVDVCGDTSVLAQPGEGILHIQPTNCQVSGDALTFSISDVTMTPSYVIWSEIPPASLSFTCGGGITEYVPWGYYDLTGIEETSASGGTIYRSYCSTIPVDVFDWGTTTYNVTLNTFPTACSF